MKQPTPQGISALLRKAGFEKSTTKPGQIRGFREWTEGDEVTKYHGGGVSVKWCPRSFRARDNNEDREREMLDRYRKVIEEAGYTVADGSASLTAKLIISANEEA